MRYLDNVSLYFNFRKYDSKRNGSFRYADWDDDLLEFYNQLGGVGSTDGVKNEHSFALKRWRSSRSMRLIYSRRENGKVHVEFFGCEKNGTVTMKKEDVEKLLTNALKVSCFMCENGYLTLKEDGGDNGA